MDLIQYGATVLIVDDDPIFITMFEQFFKNNGYKTITANNGEEATAVFAEKRPQIVMLDADMPIMDGFAACEMIRTLPDAALTPIFIVTALEGQAAFDCSVAVDATGYISKPIDWQALRNKLSCMMQFDVNS